MGKDHWDEFALLLIDVQKDFWDQDVQKSFPDFPQNIQQLLDFCRKDGLEVIHIRALFAPDQSDWMVPYRLKGSIPCIAGTEGAEALECAREHEGEKVFFKQTFDSFCQPELIEYLQKSGKRFLLTAGLVTSICVLLTTASAVQKGYLVSLVEDATADQAEAHQHTVAQYAPIFMPLVRTAELTQHRTDWLKMLDTLKGEGLSTQIWAQRDEL
jgi:ureidoacrylate peracid hydrolase